jgi:hypothetical protein
MLARWQSQVEERTSLRGSARLSVDAAPSADGEQVHVRSRQRVVLARPARLRVEVQGLIGTTLAVLAVDEQDYAFFDADSRRFESGPVHPHLLWSVVRLDLTPREAVGLLLGAPELPESARILAAHDVGDGSVRITLGGGSGPEALCSLDLDPLARLRRYAVFAGGRAPEWTARLDDYEAVGDAPIAPRVSLETRDGAHAVVTLSSIALNPPLTPDIFRIEHLRPDVGSGGSSGEGG